MRARLFEELEADRALARDHERVVERGNESRAGLVREPECALERARVVGSFEYHLRAVQRGVRHLGEGVSAGITIVAAMPSNRAW